MFAGFGLAFFMLARLKAHDMVTGRGPDRDATMPSLLIVVGIVLMLCTFAVPAVALAQYWLSSS